MKASVQNILEEFGHLPLEDREYVVDVVKKQLVDARRETIARCAREALDKLSKGAVKRGSVKDLLKDLDND